MGPRGCAYKYSAGTVYAPPSILGNRPHQPLIRATRRLGRSHKKKTNQNQMAHGESLGQSRNPFCTEGHSSLITSPARGFWRTQYDTGITVNEKEPTQHHLKYRNHSRESLNFTNPLKTLFLTGPPIILARIN